jgi:hypothetical protein
LTIGASIYVQLSGKSLDLSVNVFVK